MENIFGKKISLADADSMIKEYLQIQDITQRTVLTSSINNPKYSLDDLKKAAFLIEEEDKKNAFVFDLNLIKRFFDGTEKDKQTGEIVKANFLVVLLGAHPTQSEINGVKFEAGSLTVLTVGCNKDDNSDHFIPLNIDEPANEWPPFGKAVTLNEVQIPKEGPENSSENKYFFSKE